MSVNNKQKSLFEVAFIGHHQLLVVTFELLVMIRNENHFKGTFLFILDSRDMNPIEFNAKSMYILNPLDKSF